MDQVESNMLIFGSIPEAAGGKVRRGFKEVAQSAGGMVSEVAVATVQENMRRFLRGLGAILNVQPEDLPGLTLEQVEISAQIDGKGNIGITGVGGAEIAVQGGMRLILRKKA